MFQCHTFGIKLVAFSKYCHILIGHNFHKLQCVSSYSEKTLAEQKIETATPILIPHVGLDAGLGGDQGAFCGLAGLVSLGATLAHQLHAAAADCEGHDQLKNSIVAKIKHSKEFSVLTQRRMRRTKANMKQV